jgi:hypothetical protein
MALQGLNDAKHWRDRAAEMRVLSNQMKDFEVIKLMLKLANDYDKRARQAETKPEIEKRVTGCWGAMRKVLECEQNAAECSQRAAQMENLQLKKKLEDMADVWDRLARERRQGIVENNPDQT